MTRATTMPAPRRRPHSREASTGASGSEAASPRPAACRPGAKTTPEQTEGPYYKSGPPRRTSLLEQGVEGRRLLLAGRVLTPDCRPLAGARVDFWQADGNGVYDNDGYRLRGYQITDGRGRYRLETVVPGRYEPRTPHIHVKVTPKGGQTVTTQLYLPGEAENADDPIYQDGCRDQSPSRLEPLARQLRLPGRPRLSALLARRAAAAAQPSQGVKTTKRAPPKRGPFMPEVRSSLGAVRLAAGQAAHRRVWALARRVARTRAPGSIGMIGQHQARGRVRPEVQRVLARAGSSGCSCSRCRPAAAHAPSPPARVPAGTRGRPGRCRSGSPSPRPGVTSARSWCGRHGR